MNTLSSRAACTAAGITYRQLDYWCRLEVLEPRRGANGPGSRRGFDREDLRVLITLAGLAPFGAALSGAVTDGTGTHVLRLIAQAVRDNPHAHALRLVLDGDALRLSWYGPAAGPYLIVPVCTLERAANAMSAAA